MNVNQLLSEITYRLGNRSDLTPRTVIWLNDAYYELLLSPRFTFYAIDRSASLAAPTGQYIYQISTNFPDLWFILDIRNENYQIKLKRKDPSEFDRSWKIQGIPTRYTRFQDQIELDPIPDVDYQLTVRYRMRPPELVSGGDTLLDREWHEPLTAMAVQKGWEALEQWDKANQTKQLVEAQFARRFDAFQMDDADSEATIGVDYGT